MISFLPPLQLPHIEAALRDAKSSSAEARWVAALALGQEDDGQRDDALSALFELIGDSVPEVRAQAVEALAEQGRQGASVEVSRLEEMLGDESSDVRVSAIDALFDMADDAVALLIPLVEDPSADVRGAAIDSLGRLGADSCFPQLIQCLTDSEDWVRKEAAMALGRMGDFSGEQYLVELLTDEETLAREAVIVLSADPSNVAQEALEARASKIWGSPELKALAAAGLSGRDGEITGTQVLQSMLKSFKRRNKLAALGALAEVPRLGFVSEVASLATDRNDLVASSALLVLGGLARAIPSEQAAVERSISNIKDQLRKRLLEELDGLEQQFK